MTLESLSLEKYFSVLRLNGYTKETLIEPVVGTPGWLSLLSIRLLLRSWSLGLWVWAPHRYIHKSVPFSFHSCVTWVCEVYTKTLFFRCYCELSCQMLRKYSQLKVHFRGHLGGSVSWVSNSWFRLKSWSQSHVIKSCIWLCTEYGGCLGFFLSPSAPLPHSHLFSKNKINVFFFKVHFEIYGLWGMSQEL